MGYSSFMYEMPIFMKIFFVVFMIVFVTIIVKNISQWMKNNNSPRLTVGAVIVTKRTNVHHHMNNNAGMSNTTNTTYYVTFQVDSGDRMELRVNGSEYGMLAEGDRGQLTFQGTRYLGFERMY